MPRSRSPSQPYSAPPVDQVLEEIPRGRFSARQTPRSRRPRRRPHRLRLHRHARLGRQHASPRLSRQRRRRIAAPHQLGEELLFAENALRSRRASLLLTSSLRRDLRSGLGTLEHRVEVGDGVELLDGSEEAKRTVPTSRSSIKNALSAPAGMKSSSREANCGTGHRAQLHRAQAWSSGRGRAGRGGWR